MKTSSTRLIAVLIATTVYFATTTALACGGGGHHGGHHGHHHHGHHHGHHHHGHHHHGHVYHHTPVVRYYTPPAPVSTCSAPQPIIVSAPPAAPAPPAPQVVYAAPAASPVASAPMFPSANISLAAPEPTRLQVPAGSALMVNGQPLGATKGSVRIRIDTLTIPVEVLDWSATAARVQLPKMDLAGPMKAELEVFRADGAVASSTPIQITPAAEKLALGN